MRGEAVWRPLAVGLTWIVISATARAQAPAASPPANGPAAPSSANGPPPSPPANGAAPSPPAIAASGPPPANGPAVGAREAALEERLRRLEADNRQILELYKALAKQNAELSKRLEASIAKKPATSAGVGTAPADDAEDDEPVTAPAIEDGGAGLSTRARAGVGAQGTEGRVFPRESESRGEEKQRKRTARVEFGEGLEFVSNDDEFKLQFHDLTQAEYRLYTPNPPNAFVHSQFFIPRQRWYFTGRVTKLLEFYTVINRGYGSIDLLDAFLTYRYDDRLRFRVGRMKTPYLYEYYEIAEGDLIAPERSLYAGNLAGNRQDGAMFLGQLFDNRMGYAVGGFNGPRRSFSDTNDAKDLYVFVNTRPFLNPENAEGTRGAEGTGGRTRPNQSIEGGAPTAKEPGPFEYLNLGGAFNTGYQNNPLQPNALRLDNDQTNSAAVASISPAFFSFNNNVMELGQRTQWSAHAVWYYKSLMILAEYGGGYGGYALSGQKTSVRVPFEGYNVTTTYFITGERPTRRVNIVKPRRDFQIRNGRPFGPGAIELFARYSYLNMGKNAFTAGFADPNLWSNQAYTVDLGANWYLNFYSKIYLDWQYGGFGQPVEIAPGKLQKDLQVFWLRYQLFF